MPFGGREIRQLVRERGTRAGRWWRVQFIRGRWKKHFVRGRWAVSFGLGHWVVVV